MKKTAFFFIDDVIWAFRDVTRQRPVSLFGQPFFGSLLECHRLYGAKVQLNLFYRTAYFYGNDEFSLAEMTDAYKAEFEQNSDWLRLSFHAKEEFPDYPNVNADYQDFKDQVLMMQREVYRFAGEKSWSITSVVGHWLPISKEACQALADLGTKKVCCTFGKVEEYNGDPNSLPYGHANRLLHNRKPETKLFYRDTRDVAISRSICGYNHVSEEEYAATFGTEQGRLDPETGLIFKVFKTAGLINLCATKAEVKEDVGAVLHHPHLCFGNHEQYYYPEYFAYQPNIVEKVLYACQLAHEARFTFVTGDELVG